MRVDRIPRFLGPILGLGAVGGTLAAACASWTLDWPAANGFVARGFAERFGIALATNGPTRFTLLPLPRIAFSDIRLGLGGDARSPSAAGGTLTVQLDPTALLLGRAEPVALALDGATLVLPRDALMGSETGWRAGLKRLGGLIAGGTARPQRISLSRIAVDEAEPGEPHRRLASDVELVLAWPSWTATAALEGGLTWKGKALRFSVDEVRPATLAGGGESPASLQVAWSEGSFGGRGTVTTKDGLRASGDAVLASASLSDLRDWLGIDMALVPLVDDLAIEARVELQDGAVELPRLVVRTGGAVLNGAGSIELSGRRPSIRATLDADELNLGPLVGGVLRVTGCEDEAWSRAPLALRPLTGGDLDLRLSGTGARLGPLRFGSFAASVLVRADTIDATLNRANLEGGTLKGHLHLASAGTEADERTELRATGAFTGLDTTVILAALGQPDWVLGSAQGDFALEGTGRDAASLVRSVAGRARLGIGNGALAGLDLARVVTRKGVVAQGALARRNGRTPFDHASVVFDIRDGVGAIAQGVLASRTMQASLRGRVSLPERRIAARAELLPRAPAPGQPASAGTRFEIAGPWDGIAVFGPGIPESPADALATAAERPAEVRADTP